MKYLIQTYGGATIHVFTNRKARDSKLAELRTKHPRTPYTTKEIK